MYIQRGNYDLFNVVTTRHLENHLILATTEDFKCFHWYKLVEISYSSVIFMISFFTPLMNETKFSSHVFNQFDLELKLLACPHLLSSSLQLHRLQPRTEKPKPTFLA